MSEAPKSEVQAQSAAPSSTAQTRKTGAPVHAPAQPVQGELKNTVNPPANEYPFSVAVADVYDGPLDLLLDLIRKQDIDIYDIPIAQITAQYLLYVEKIKQLDVNLAADFVYMASVLIHIKSKMLLPRDPTLPADQQEDPRVELVNRLLEHERFKTAAQMLSQKQQIEEAVVTNPAIRQFKDAEGTDPELAVDIVDLVKTFRELLGRIKERPVLSVDEDNISVGTMIDYVRRRMMLEEKPIRLKHVFKHLNSNRALVCAFLAVLELVRLQAVILRQEGVFGEIVLKKHTGFDTAFGDQAAVKDDWR
jgi:segregation and condensation protein A